MPEREAAITTFLADHGWAAAQRSVLAKDASFRSYDRLTDATRRAVLMDAPPPEEDTRPFIQIAEHLRSLGLHAPEIYAQDTEQGLLLLEDFGDHTYARAIEANPKRESALYELAIDVLIHLHKTPEAELIPAGLPPYDSQFLYNEVEIFLDWYLPHVLPEPLPTEARVSYEALWRDLFEHVQKEPQCLVLRDFHIDNLILMEDRAGLDACGLLDFQGALAGARAYDLMSILEDARRDIEPDLVTHLKHRYFAAFAELAADGPARQAFEASYAILGAGRHAKVIGIFDRLAQRDSKPGYLHHIPRVWRLLERSLEHPMLAAVADWFDAYVPGPLRITPDPQPHK